MTDLRVIRLTDIFEDDFRFSNIVEPFWFDTWNWDIPNTMIGLINSMPPTCKRITMVRFHGPDDLDRIQAAADAKRIELNWVFPEPLRDEITRINAVQRT